ncbi:hypothetical protein [Singulisphaera sp. PoT]|uniref:hypothetical protein n=1 Tax=Singulisphaera sp. PoT TaxID=3411797 RepID=UPI003BF5C56D
MARPKMGQLPKSPEERSERETVIHMKGSPEYVDWLENAHRETHIPKVQIFRLALATWAAKNGLSQPPDI